jgi:predicted MPP superfamily phosphohydrolase
MKLFKRKRPFIIILIALLFLFAVKAYYDTNSIEVRHYEIKNSSLGSTLSGLKVGHLSDLHIKDIGTKENKILEILKRENPDLIFVTGDLISFGGPYEPAMSFLRQLKPLYGIYEVLGNTEYSNENGSCILCHDEKSRSLKKKPNPVVLRNSSIPLRINGRVVNIIGVDDPVTKKSDLKVAIQKIDEEVPSILLAHSPEVFEEASGFKIDLLLCGHTHGGQIFLTRYLRKIIPLDASLEFIEGFFQKGKALMYVSRGIGTSYLPFRLGIKPEITFFTFSVNSTNPTNPSNSINTVSISNTTPMTFFTGLSLSSLIETFNILNIFDSLRLTAPQQHSSPLNNPSNPTNSINSSDSINSKILFDFESEEDLKRLNWECQKWFGLSEKNVTSGKYCLKVVLPPGEYPGINFHEIRHDWSEFRSLRMDIFNPAEEKVNLCIRIDDKKSGSEYANRFDTVFELKQGINQISIPTDSIRTNMHHRPLNLKQIKRIIVFIMNNKKQRELYIDNIRLDNHYSN